MAMMTLEGGGFVQRAGFDCDESGAVLDRAVVLVLPGQWRGFVMVRMLMIQHQFWRCHVDVDSRLQQVVVLFYTSPFYPSNFQIG